jgi:hypothetical protein
MRDLVDLTTAPFFATARTPSGGDCSVPRRRVS